MAFPLRGPDVAARRQRRLARAVRTGVAPMAVLTLLGAGAAVTGTGPFSGTAPQTEQVARILGDGTVMAADRELVIDGRGHGHGRGMGQWGAFGYAADHGWSHEQILAHYYGGTELASVETGEITVRLTALDGRTLEAVSDGPMTVAGQHVAPGTAVTMTPTGAGAQVALRAGCGGETVWSGETDDPWLRPAPDAAPQPIRLCPGAADPDPGEGVTGTAYRGALGVAIAGDGTARTVNRLGVEDYLRGAVPTESPASWSDSGGAAALRAQAVAARSYALTQQRYPYAEICDTQACQVYGGVDHEDPRTDAAIAETAGQVLMRGGEIVTAEYTASTGGHSAGGDFPAVTDEGDTRSPNHRWTDRRTAGQVGEAFGVGDLIAIEIVESDGEAAAAPEPEPEFAPAPEPEFVQVAGVPADQDVPAAEADAPVDAAPAPEADPGRIRTLRVTGTDGVREVTGDEARRILRLKSDWFTVG